MELTNPQETEAKVAARYQVFLILWIAILISVGIFFGLATFVPVPSRPNPNLSYVLLGIGVAFVAVSILIKSVQSKQAIESRSVSRLQSAHILGLALCETAALFGLLDHFVTGSVISRFGFAVAALGMLWHFPRKNQVRSASYKGF